MWAVMCVCRRVCHTQAQSCLSTRWALNRYFAWVSGTAAVLPQGGGGYTISICSIRWLNSVAIRHFLVSQYAQWASSFFFFMHGSPAAQHSAESRLIVPQRTAAICTTHGVFGFGHHLLFCTQFDHLSRQPAISCVRTHAELTLHSLSSASKLAPVARHHKHYEAARSTTLWLYTQAKHTAHVHARHTSV